MRSELRLAEAETRRRALSTAGLLLPVAPETGSCPRCSGLTYIRRSTPRHIITIAHGDFTVQETVRICAKGCTHPSGKPVILRSERLARLVPPGGNHGYDLEVHVGLQRFLNNRQRKENLQSLLDKHRISLSSGQVSILARRFLDHLEALHWKRAPQLAAAMRADGGYPMSIDATGEDGQGTILVVYNSWRGWVLGAWKISTERADLVLPHLRQVLRAFGPPCAIMRDLGKAMMDKVTDWMRDVSHIDTPAKMEGKNMVGLFVPGPPPKKKVEKKPDQEVATKVVEATPPAEEIEKSPVAEEPINKEPEND